MPTTPAGARGLRRLGAALVGVVLVAGLGVGCGTRGPALGAAGSTSSPTRSSSVPGVPTPTPGRLPSGPTTPSTKPTAGAGQQATGRSTTSRPAAVTDPRLAKKLGKVMADRRVRQALSGAVVLDAKSGSVLYSRHGTQGTTPASTTKVLTAAAAMDSLGPGYRFRTEVGAAARPVGGVLTGDLILKGFGDPTTRESDYRRLARQVAAAGVRRVTGGVVADATYFDDHRYPGTWSKSYASSYYAAETSALTFTPDADLNPGTVFVSYAAGARGRRATLSTIPASAAAALHLANKTTTGARGSRLTAVVGRRYGSKTITVSGRVPAGRSGRALVTVSDPQRVAAAVFRAELVKAGVRVAKPTRVAHAPTTARVRLGLDRSITVAKLLVPFLKLSNNQHAEALTKAMGAQLRHSGSWSAGTAVTRAFVSRLGVSTKGLVLVDGSGLSRRTRVTPRQLAAVLFAAQQRSWSPAFYRALPVAADRRRMVGGTLRLRFTGTRAAHNAHAKTGSLTGVTALAGYVTGADGHRYVFAMLSHYHRISPRPLENSLVITLANHRR